MLDTSARLLRLLSLLQTHRDWTGPELAERLGITTRTVRRDVDRLRTLGYPVNAVSGTAGGYRLGAGAALPPLLLDDDEAVAVAISLRTAAGGTVTGIEETCVRALAKLEQVLPARLRRRVNTLHSVTVPLLGSGPTADGQLLATIAAACRDHEGLRFTYRDREQAASRRSVQPHRLVHTGRRWYLLAWDGDREDWRTFRVDRIEPGTSPGPRFRPRDLDDAEVAERVSRGVSVAPYRYQATIRLHAPAAAIGERVPPSVGMVEADGPDRCILRVGSDSLDGIIGHTLFLGVDFEVLGPPELIEHVRTLTERLGRAAG